MLSDLNSNASHLYVNLEHYFLSWYLLVILSIGLLGGLFCLIFMILSRLFPTNLLIWMIAISVADLGILLFDGLRMTIKIHSNSQFDIRDVNDSFCKIHNFLSNYFFYLSAYMQTCMSIHRLYFIWYPLRARLLLRKRIVIIAMVIVSGLIIIPMLPYLLYWKVNPKNNDCEPLSDLYYRWTSALDAILWGLIPLIIMTVSTALIAYKMTESHFSNIFICCQNCNNQQQEEEEEVASKKCKERKKESIDNNKTEQQQQKGDGENEEGNKLLEINASIVTTTTTNNQSKKSQSQSFQGHGQRHHRNSQKKSSQHITRLLVIINLFYLATTYPLLIYLLILNFIFGGVGPWINQDVHKTIYYLLRSICYLNSSCNWILYFVSGQIFRQKVKEVIWNQLIKRRTCARLSKESHSSRL